VSFKLTAQFLLPTVTRELIAAGIMLLITCAAKLTFIILWVPGLMCLSGQQVINIMFVSFM